MEDRLQHNRDNHKKPSILNLIKNCPLCKKNYVETDVKTIEKREDSELIHLSCASCHAGMLAMVMMAPFGIGSIGMVTDLNAEDATRIKHSQPVSGDDVIEFYELLEKGGCEGLK
jgi:hypothetical protein